MRTPCCIQKKKKLQEFERSKNNPSHSIKKNADGIIRIKHINENERKIRGRKKPEIKKHYNQMIEPLHKWCPNLNNNTA